jgi:anthranilate phosphoribosyltransferase
MATLAALTAQLAARTDLGPDQIRCAAADLTSTEVALEDKTAFLAALADKGETAGEVASFASAFLDRAVDPGVGAWAKDAIDIVGTGGDHAGGFNVSSLVVLVLACAGVTVMKHGNRGITSKCGSADIMSGLGIDIEAPPEIQRRALAELGFAYFFAPAYHPSFRNVGPARKAMAAQGRRSIFNILGPLINPGRPSRILLGVFSESWVPRMAGALERLGTSSGLVVHGSLGGGGGIDELTSATVNRVLGVGSLASVDRVWRAADFGLPECPFSDLKGGDLAANLALTESLLSGRGPSGLADTIALNASAALWICGRTSDPAAGVALARDLLVGGAVRRKIEDARAFFRSP